MRWTRSKMKKVHTKVRAGQLVAVYVEDGQGRRLVLARPDGELLRDPLIPHSKRGEGR
jgi:hypothetical protein